MYSAGVVSIGEDAGARVRCENEIRHGTLLVLASSLIGAVVKQLVLPDRSSDRTAENVFVQERPLDTRLVVEPIICGYGTVSILPKNFSTRLIGARRADKIVLGSASSDRRARVGSRNTEFVHLTDAQAVG